MKRPAQQRAGSFYYGGQAVLEGVMIRGRRLVAVAVRRPRGDIALRTETLGGVYSARLRRIPFLRGIIVLWETLALGTRALIFSSNVALEEEEGEVSGPFLWATVGVALVFVIALIFVGPVLATGLLEDAIDNERLAALVEGVIRLAVLLGYLGVIGLVPDIRRVFAYHGAEHKSINALEAGAPLEVASVQPFSTAHPRCGTSFLLVVVVISVVLFVLVGTPPLWQRLLSRVGLVPVIAALSYELIRLAGAFQGNRVVRVIFAPNLWLQSLTTREPDDSQVEVALHALREVLAGDGEITSDQHKSG
ncbi:MAG TPA: DUF1385 domain-containing protein [Dehalococcoidia bacterium]|nr:DUF1385 domain-containing protein [Dehalococcoidia bacterium]